MPNKVLVRQGRTPRRLDLPPGRPILDKDRVMELCQQVMGMTTGDDAEVWVEHTATSFTRLANGTVTTSNDGDQLNVNVRVQFSAGQATLTTDQLEPDVLRSLVRETEDAAKEQGESDEVIVPDQDKQDDYVPVQLWHDSTVDAMRESRATLLPEMLGPIAKQGLTAAGYVGFYAHAEGLMRKASGIHGFYDETDCELSVTARTKDGASSGWGGQAARRWEDIKPEPVTAQAIDLAQRGVNAKAMEPGRYTAILTREAVAQIMRYFAEFYDAFQTEHGNTPFYKPDFPPNRINQKVFDSRVSMRSDPADTDGGFAPFNWGYGNPVMDWAKDGVLSNLAFGIFDAVYRRKPYSDFPLSMRMSGGTTSIEQMIAQCKQGIYVNHFSSVDLLQRKTGVMTGTTRDGCFLVKDGKVDTPLKNYRFIDSPMFMLNNIIAMGESKRAAYGYTPQGADEWNYFGEWPRRPMIVPPLMIRDFNFTSLADAV